MEIIAHRGASEEAPENTLASARLAWDQGADALECDVHLTRDGELAVIHDEDTARVAGTRLVVRETDWAHLHALEVGRWKDPRFTGEKIPSLGALLATVPWGRRIFIEIKGGPEVITALGKTLARSPVPPEQIAIISFDRAAVEAAKAAFPACEAAWILDPPGTGPTLEEALAQARAAGLDGLDLEATWRISPSAAQQMRRDGFKLYVWTVDDPSVARRWRETGVDGITTNRPRALRQEIAP